MNYGRKDQHSVLTPPSAHQAPAGCGLADPMVVAPSQSAIDFGSSIIAKPMTKPILKPVCAEAITAEPSSSAWRQAVKKASAQLDKRCSQIAAELEALQAKLTLTLEPEMVRPHKAMAGAQTVLQHPGARDAEDPPRQLRHLEASFTNAQIAIANLAVALSDMACRLPAFSSESAIEAAQDPHDRDALLLSLRGLTPRQRDVLARLAEGKPNKLIAYELGICETTVKAHVSVVLRKLHVHSRAQAILILTK